MNRTLLAGLALGVACAAAAAVQEAPARLVNAKMESRACPRASTGRSACSPPAGRPRVDRLLGAGRLPVSATGARRVGLAPRDGLPRRTGQGGRCGWRRGKGQPRGPARHLRLLPRGGGQRPEDSRAVPECEIDAGGLPVHWLTQVNADGERRPAVHVRRALGREERPTPWPTPRSWGWRCTRRRRPPGRSTRFVASAPAARHPQAGGLLARQPRAAAKASTRCGAWSATATPRSARNCVRDLRQQGAGGGGHADRDGPGRREPRGAAPGVVLGRAEGRRPRRGGRHRRNRARPRHRGEEARRCSPSARCRRKKACRG